MTKHVHAEMIKAKADNMELVVFVKYDEGWTLSGYEELICLSDREFFLCLPQHKESCLHWLNGGKIQYKTELVPEFQDYQPDIEFGLGSIFMQPDFEIRIKPRKEKRHIYISTLGATTYAKKTKEEAAREVNIMGGSFDIWKHYEIEIEVEI